MNNAKCHPMAKRLLSALFAIALVTGLVPISAYAAAGDSQSATPAETTQSQEQGTQVTGKGPIASSNKNGVAGIENAISLADNGISLASSNDDVWRYNGEQGITEKAIYNKLAATFKYRLGFCGLPYSGYKIEDKMFTTASASSDKLLYPESRTYNVVGAINFVRWRNVGDLTFQKQWDTTFSITPAGEGSIVKQDGSSFVDNKDTSNDNATVKFKVEKVSGKNVTVNRYNSKGNKLFDRDQPTLVGEDEKYITYSFTADRNSTVKVEYKATSA